MFYLSEGVGKWMKLAQNCPEAIFIINDVELSVSATSVNYIVKIHLSNNSFQSFVTKARHKQAKR
jgi:hypothetical protein